MITSFVLILYLKGGVGVDLIKPMPSMGVCLKVGEHMQEKFKVDFICKELKGEI